MYLLLRVNKKIKIKENVVFVSVFEYILCFSGEKNIGMSPTLYNIVFCALSVNSKKKKLNIQCMYWENITFLMLWILSMKMYIKTLTQMQTKWNDNYKIMLSTACNLEVGKFLTLIFTIPNTLHQTEKIEIYCYLLGNAH